MTLGVKRSTTDDDEEFYSLQSHVFFQVSDAQQTPEQSRNDDFPCGAKWNHPNYRLERQSFRNSRRCLCVNCSEIVISHRDIVRPTRERLRIREKKRLAKNHTVDS